MGLLQYFKTKKDHKQQLKEIGFETSDCDQECASCTTRFPSSMTIDNTDDIWDSAKPFGLHIVVPSDKADWKHDAIDEPGTLQYEVDKWSQTADLHYLEGLTRAKVSVSSLSSPKFHSDEEYNKGTKGDLLLLPFFVWIKEIRAEHVGRVLDLVLPKLATARSDHSRNLPDFEFSELPNVLVEPALEQAFIFLCSHKTRDKRCGITAPIMKKEMDMHLRDLGLYRDFGDSRRDGVLVSFVNHIGGHKYAANVIIYLRKSGKNIWLARCNPKNAAPLIDECVVNDGRVWPEKVRQVQKFASIEW